MRTYRDDLATLGHELSAVDALLGSLSEAEWSAPTRLVPVDPAQPPWTVLQLAGHLGFAMSMLETLLSAGSALPPRLDRVAFLRLPRAEVGPVVYRTAVQVVDGRTPAEVLGYCRRTSGDALARAESVDPSFVGSPLVGEMRVDEFVVTRIVEAVVHGLDLGQALDLQHRPTDGGLEATAAVLDDLLWARDQRRRPAALVDDWTWVRVASGRARHPDLVAPLIN
jgi:uncharacterized protein (TIGR03083 family)